ncbi:2-polyprenyl-6-methoxyphenol hydroxylase [Nocardioides eburneiflavus]|uniref:2-polyprenyl-6-methoxyphenol hydroxylase n=1 Tax=Nocardioides eburneiflavus TaxID=2518372 RepID=A0A4Z1CB34_9ACTN|nr:FAD-dependent monooxygenase [Nocardioides eburneiflavus]TGN64746.1 2-polyprenyl-6-methoxyphenol hydroxylase [Nocardioides eburneiflavus]
MPAVRSVLVVGAGAAGCATATLLAEAGVSVDLIDIKPDVSALGSGITLQGNALRVLRQLGVWGRVTERGYAFDTLGLRAPDPDGTLIVELTDVRTGGDDLPATVGMYRPDLAGILVDRATGAGAKVRFGTTCTAMTQDDTGVDVTFADGSSGRYDLVVGADGIRSRTRRQLGIDLETRSTGMGIWRVFAPRPASVTRTDLYYGGPCYIAGYCPTGEDSVYAYLVEDAQDRSRLSPEESLDVMRSLAAAYHGPWDEIRESMTDPARVNHTLFETHLLDAPWHRGRVVLIGDAAHTCPPTLAQGAAQALEDAAVLAELLLAHDAVGDELWTAFTDRRLPRSTEVVDASVQLGQWLLDREEGDVPALMARIAHLLAEPA